MAASKIDENSAREAIYTVISDLKKNDRIESDVVLTKQQEDSILSVLLRNGTLVLLDTGSGKSWIFMLLPLIVNALRKKADYGLTDYPLVPVISPLNAVINDQINSASKLDCYSSFDDVSRKASLIYGSPELWLDNKKCRQLLYSQRFFSSCIAIVVDEAHKVTWGRKENKSTPFRECFSRLAEMRALMKSGIPIVALTAKADLDYQQLIKTTLKRSPNLNVIFAAIDRRNIRFRIIKILEGDMTCLNWIVELMRQKQIHTPKIIIYCKSLVMAGSVYNFIVESLGDDAYQRKPFKSINCFVGLYNFVTTSLLEDEGCCRLVVATSALGMGINPKNVEYVIHYGLPVDIADYIQQVGRCGRNLQTLCHSVVYYYPRMTIKCSFKMKNALKLCDNQCIPKAVYGSFNRGDLESVNPLHNCCSFCHTTKCD